MDEPHCWHWLSIFRLFFKLQLAACLEIGDNQSNPRYPFSLTTMPIAYLTLELRIESAHSLKDKRQVVRSLKDRLRNSFNVAIAEIEVTDLWQRATLGVVSISDSRDYLDGLMRNVEREAVRLANNAGAEVVDSFVDFVEIGESGDRDIG